MPFTKSHLINDFSLWSAPSQFLTSYWSGTNEILNRRSGVIGLSSFNHLVQYCVTRGLFRSNSFSMPESTQLIENAVREDIGQMSMEFFELNKEIYDKSNWQKKCISKDHLDYELSLLKSVVLKNYGSLHSLVPNDFDEEVLGYPYKTSLVDYFCSLEQIQKQDSFTGHDFRCELLDLSFPQAVSARYVCTLWCEFETRPVEVILSALFNYGLFAGITKGGAMKPTPIL